MKDLKQNLVKFALEDVTYILYMVAVEFPDVQITP